MVVAAGAFAQAGAFGQDAVAEKLRGAEYKLTEMTVNGEPVPVPSSPVVTIKFGDENRVHGRAPVNFYFGAFYLAEDGKLHWASPGFGSTMMAGPEDLMSLESKYFQALHGTDRMVLVEQTLTLDNEAGTARLVFEQTGPDVVQRLIQGKTLVVTKLIYGGKEVNLPVEPMLTLVLSPRGVSGFGGVNWYRAGIQRTERGGFRIDAMATTRRAGPPELMMLEQTFLAALGKVTHAIPSLNGLVLRDDSGSIVIEFMAGR